MAVAVDKWQYVQLVLSKHGPASQSLRLVLLSIAAEASNSQWEAWPSQQRIAERCQLGARQTKRLVKLGEGGNWLRRRWARKPGATWRFTVYEFVVPDSLRHEVPVHPWDSDPEWKQGAKVMAPSSEQRAAQVSPCSHESVPETAPERFPNPSKGPSGAGNVPPGASNVPNNPGDKVTFGQSKGTSRCPTTFPSEVPIHDSPHDSTHGARRTARVRGSEQIREDDPEVQRKRREASRIVDELTARASR